MVIEIKKGLLIAGEDIKRTENQHIQNQSAPLKRTACVSEGCKRAERAERAEGTRRICAMMKFVLFGCGGCLTLSVKFQGPVLKPD